MDETRLELTLMHEQIVSFMMVLLVIAVSLILAKEISNGNIKIGTLIIALGIMGGIFGIMAIISEFYKDAPKLNQN